MFISFFRDYCLFYFHCQTSKTNLLCISPRKICKGDLRIFETLENNIERVNDITSNIIVLGDLNCNILVKNTLSRKIQNLCDCFNFRQLISKPTRVTPTSRSCIDLIFVPSVESDFHSDVISLGISDHSLVYVNLKKECFPKKPAISKFRSFRKFDQAKFVSDGEKLPWSNFYKRQ